MNFYIKEWPDDTATLMTERGHVIWIFPSVEEAEAAAENGDDIIQPDNDRPEKAVRHPRHGAKDRSRNPPGGVEASLDFIGAAARR